MEWDVERRDVLDLEEIHSEISVISSVDVENAMDVEDVVEEEEEDLPILIRFVFSNYISIKWIVVFSVPNVILINHLNQRLTVDSSRKYSIKRVLNVRAK